jgi:hypothetical protein
MLNIPIEERIQKLEKDLARSKRRLNYMLAINVALLLLAIIFWKPIQAQAAWATDVMHGRAFILEDENGDTRAELFMDENMPRLTFYDENGDTAAELGLFENGAALTFTNSKDSKSSGSIVGSVYMDGRPVAGHILVKDTKTGQVVAQADTNMNGHYIVKDLDEGEYDLQYLNMQGVPFGRIVRLFVREGLSEVIDIQLSVTDRMPIKELPK